MKLFGDLLYRPSVIRAVLMKLNHFPFYTLCVHVCPCLVHAVTEMLVNVLNIHGEDDDDDDPSETGGEGG